VHFGILKTGKRRRSFNVFRKNFIWLYWK